MATLIPVTEMIELKSASDVKAVADAASAIHEQQSVAYAINQAANSGQHAITWSSELSEEIQELLKSKGYKVVQNQHAADSSRSWRIFGF